MRARALRLMGALVACSTTLAVTTVVAPIASAAAPSVQHLCSTPQPGYRSCFGLRLVRHDATSRTPVAATSAPSGFGPADLRSAYDVTPDPAAAPLVAIVDAADDPNAEADLAVYRSTYGLPPCTTASGCFRKRNQVGQASPLPTPDTGWSEEISLDLDMVSAACPYCHIALVEAFSATDADLDAAFRTAATLHPAAISNSYGGGESASQTADDAVYNVPGTAVVASSGDVGYQVQYPASSPHVIAVGATTLVRDTSARGWKESAWFQDDNDATSSGCSAIEPKPTWQTDAGCTRRSVADLAMDGDPNTGVAVYSTFGNDSPGWGVYGGTSVGAPFVAAMYAQSGNPSSYDYPAEYAYENPSAFNDVTTGRTSTGCTSYLCQAQGGYDGPTGVGTPNGLDGLGGALVVANDFTLFFDTAGTSVNAGSSTSVQLDTVITSGLTEPVALTVTGAPAGMTATLSPSPVGSGQDSTLLVSTTTGVVPGSYPLTVTGTASSGSHSTGFLVTVNPQPSDFTVALGSSAGSETAGTSTSVALSTSLVSGPAETVALSVSGLPAGVTASFDPTSVPAGAGSTLTLSSAVTTTPGSYPLLVTGTAPSGTHAQAYTLTVTRPCPTVRQLLGNPGFESGATAWTATAGVISSDTSGAIGPHSGKSYAWLDGYGHKHTDTLTQTVTLPLGCQSYRFGFSLKVVTAETTTKAVYDTLSVTAGGSALASYSNLNRSGAYVQHVFDLSAYAGRTVTLSFKGMEDSSLATSFLVDDATLTAG